MTETSGPEVVGLGESMVMVTPILGGRLDASSTFVLRSGGAESNVAMFLSDLGHRTGWASRLGADRLGKLLFDQVRDAGVDVSLVDWDDGRPTGVYFKDPHRLGTDVYYYRSGSAAAAMGDEVLPRLVEAEPRVLHLSGITPALSPSCAELVRRLMVERPLASTVVTFDVNYRPSLWQTHPAEEMLELARSADVVFVGLDEAESLWGAHDADEVRSLLPEPVTLVVKNKDVEAVCYSDHGTARADALPVAVVEPVGAGDAFAAGWIAGMLRDLTPVQCLLLGHLVAGVALGSEGDHNAPPADSTICATLGIDLKEWKASVRSRQGT